MAEAPGSRPPTPQAVFKPRFSLSLLYLFAFFILYLALLVLPEWATRVPIGDPDDVEAVAAAREVARDIARTRVLPALVLAVGTLTLGAWKKVLPGMKD